MSFSHTKSNYAKNNVEMKKKIRDFPFAASSFFPFSAWLLSRQKAENTNWGGKGQIKCAFEWKMKINFFFLFLLTSITIEDCTSVLLYSQPLSQCCKGHDSFGTSKSISVFGRIIFQSTAYRRHLSYTCSPFFCSREKEEKERKEWKSNLV